MAQLVKRPLLDLTSGLDLWVEFKPLIGICTECETYLKQKAKQTKTKTPKKPEEYFLHFDRHVSAILECTAFTECKHATSGY